MRRQVTNVPFGGAIVSLSSYSESEGRYDGTAYLYECFLRRVLLFCYPLRKDDTVSHSRTPGSYHRSKPHSRGGHARGALFGDTLACLPVHRMEEYRSESTRDRGNWFYRQSSSG
jgi:hypothetical protein